MTNNEYRHLPAGDLAGGFRFRISGFGLLSDFVIRNSALKSNRKS